MKPHQFQTLTGPKSRITIATERRVILVHWDHGTIDLPFSHCLGRAQAIAKELNFPIPTDPGLDPVGLEALYLYYWALFDIARRGNDKLPYKFLRTKSAI